MIEIRIHGRGGQGNVAAAELLAVAAFKDGKFAQAFPAFGAERVGAPVQAFVRIDEKKIRTRDEVRAPDYLIVQDYYLIGSVPVLDGLNPDGTESFSAYHTARPDEQLDRQLIYGRSPTDEVGGSVYMGSDMEVEVNDRVHRVVAGL